MQSPVDWFEDYVVDAALGHGGHATVYRAHGVLDPDRVVALKVLDDYHCQPVQMARLEREFAFANVMLVAMWIGLSFLLLREYRRRSPSVAA